MRNLKFAEKEFYHIYNRGVDKRDIFLNEADLERFFKAMTLLNREKSIGSIRDFPRDRHGVSEKERLVRIIAYCLNSNHFHFILEQIEERGIERFMHKVGMSHSKYINAKYGRNGALFQGGFGAKRIDSNEYLLHLSAYINLNSIAHNHGHQVASLCRTSWNEYVADNYPEEVCEKKIILEQFKSRNEYQKFAEESLKSILERKMLLSELENVGIERVYTK